MKTFTLRLNDNEAEALERLLYVRPENSKNELINNMIVSVYTGYLECSIGADSWPPANYNLKKHFIDDALKTYGRYNNPDCLLRIVKSAVYDLNNAATEEEKNSIAKKLKSIEDRIEAAIIFRNKEVDTYYNTHIFSGMFHNNEAARQGAISEMDSAIEAAIYLLESNFNMSFADNDVISMFLSIED